MEGEWSGSRLGGRLGVDEVDGGEWVQFGAVGIGGVGEVIRSGGSGQAGRRRNGRMEETGWTETAVC